MISRIKSFVITGGIACGKSTVAAWLPQWGGDVLDADNVVHEMEAPGGAAVPLIAGAFGSGMLRSDGAVDRARLGQMVFADPGALERLNRLIHPLVRQRLESWLAAPAPRGRRFRAAVIPLLFEVGWNLEPCDAVIAVVCDEAEQMRRLTDRGLALGEARRRIAAQMPCADKARRADHVLWNNGSLEALHWAARKLFEDLLEKKS